MRGALEDTYIISAVREKLSTLALDTNACRGSMCTLSVLQGEQLLMYKDLQVAALPPLGPHCFSDATGSSQGEALFLLLHGTQKVRRHSAVMMMQASLLDSSLRLAVATQVQSCLAGQ